MIPYGRQQLDQADKDAVVSVLNSDYLTQGPQLPAFEAAVADYCQDPGSPDSLHAIAVNSGTAAASSSMSSQSMITPAARATAIRWIV